MGTQYHQNDTTTSGFSMIYIFANVLFFNDMFTVYEFQEKLNIEYYSGHIVKSEGFHNGWTGFQGRNIEC